MHEEIAHEAINSSDESERRRALVELFSDASTGASSHGPSDCRAELPIGHWPPDEGCHGRVS